LQVVTNGEVFLDSLVATHFYVVCRIETADKNTGRVEETFCVVVVTDLIFVNKSYQLFASKIIDEDLVLIVQLPLDANLKQVSVEILVLEQVFVFVGGRNGRVDGATQL